MFKTEVCRVVKPEPNLWTAEKSLAYVTPEMEKLQKWMLPVCHPVGVWVGNGLFPLVSVTAHV